MADDPKTRSAGGKETDKVGIDGNKRAFFRSLFGPVTAIVGKYEGPVENEGVILSKNPPLQNRVIRGGANAEVMALLGPLARGEAAATGYRLENVAVGRDRIDFVFTSITGPERGNIRNVAVALTALDATDGQASWTTTSFRLVITGDAPPEEQALVGERVAREVAKVDVGQLWVVAAVAPLEGGGDKR